MAVKIVESYSVSPSSGAAAELTLPFLHFDIVWLDNVLIETLHFYPFNCSESHFLDTILVNLKHSLSLTLKHFLPLASKIIFPLTSAATPLSRYTAGDSLSLTIATSDDNFSYLVSNFPKPADKFHQLVPQMPAAVHSSDHIKFRAFAIQLTLFPNNVIVDIKQIHHLLPFYGRDSVQESKKLIIAHWNQMKTNTPTVSLTQLPFPSDRVRATFHLSLSQIEKLKRWIMIKKPSIGRPSSFAAACAYIWSCLNKCGGDRDNDDDDDEIQYFGSP